MNQNYLNCFSQHDGVPLIHAQMVAPVLKQMVLITVVVQLDTLEQFAKVCLLSFSLCLGEYAQLEGLARLEICFQIVFRSRICKNLGFLLFVP